MPETATKIEALSDPYDAKRVEIFLTELRTCPNVSAACRVAKIGRATVYEWREAYPEFAAAWQHALLESIEDLEGEAYRRARFGTEKPVYYQGEQCGEVQEYSDTLAIFLLKAHKPEKYRERFEHTGEISIRQVAEVPSASPSVAEWEGENAKPNSAAAGGTGVSGERTGDSTRA